jgi:sugar lactone lactonase YvrE
MKRILVFACLSLSLAHAQKGKIIFKQPAFYPEGIAFNKSNNTFFIGSVKTGNIGVVDMAGNYNNFHVDASLKSSFGMKVDVKRNLLWLCTGDPTYSVYSDSNTYKKLARLIAIDLSTSKKVKDIDLAKFYNGKHFINDLVLDSMGNVYVTDSYSPVIYKVSTDGRAGVFVQSDFFKGADIGLNGIVWHKDNFLLTVNNNNGSILKVNSNGGVAMVKINQFFPGADGLLLDEQGKLILVQNKGVNKVFAIVSKDNWATAEVESETAATDLFQNPSTATMVNGKVYALNSKLNELQDPSLKPSMEFSIQPAMFRSVK